MRLGKRIARREYLARVASGEIPRQTRRGRMPADQRLTGSRPYPSSTSEEGPR